MFSRLTLASKVSRSAYKQLCCLILGIVPLVSSAASPDDSQLVRLGAGDSVTLQVYGQPDMTSSSIFIGDDGAINVPLAGAVKISGLSPVDAAARVENALQTGGFLLDPHVTIALAQNHSQRVSVLGEVRQPGRYILEPNSTVFDLLAQAGGVTESGADAVYVTRRDSQGSLNRYDIKLKHDGTSVAADQRLQGGDNLYVPRAEQFYIYGEVKNPNMYRIEPGMTVIQAIARAGGITDRGSERRIDIKRANKDHHYVITHAKPSDAICNDDVVHIKESIF